MSLQNNYIQPHENDLLEGLVTGGYFKAIDAAKLSKKKFLETLIQIQEEERKKLGHELHDSVNSSLTIAKFYLGLLPAGTKEEKHAKEQLAFIITTTEQSIRSISCELVVCQEAESGLVQLLKNLCNRINGLGMFTLSFNYYEKAMLDSLPYCQKIVLYRIVQEQLNNTIKYSQATEVSVNLHCNGKLVNMQIKDNGVGFDTDAPVAGIGLSNIKNRVKQFNGDAVIKSAPGKGCLTLICMPVLE